MSARVQPNRISTAIGAGAFVALALAMSACDPELADWLEAHHNGGTGSVNGGGGVGNGGGGAGAGGAGAGGAGGAGGGRVDPGNACAAILCPPDTVCEVQQVMCVRAPCPPIATCVKRPPLPPKCPPVCVIFCEFGNVLNSDGCATCSCNPPPPVDPCSLVGCETGGHCEAKPVVCIAAPCRPVATCVPDAPPIRCGGLGQKGCPGAGTCAAEANDACGSIGGADCGGVCQCNVTSTCAKGLVFDTSPAVCACAAAVIYPTSR